MSTRDGAPYTSHEPFDRNGDLFESTYRNASSLARASIDLDEALDAIAPIIIDEENKRVILNVMSREEYSEKLDAAHARGVAELQKTEEHMGGTWNDLYRLASQIFTMTARIRAESVFMMYEAFDERRRTVDGITAQFVEVLKHALIDYANKMQVIEQADNPDERDLLVTELGQLRGAIDELVILVLLNYEEVPSKLALTSKVYDDLYGRIDIVLFHAKAREKDTYKSPIQVKSSRVRTGEGNDAPENGFTLYASDYDPDGSNTLAKILLAHFEGHKKPDFNFTKNMDQYLQDALAKIRADVQRHLEITPGIKLAQIKGLPGNSSENQRFATKMLAKLLPSIVSQQENSA